MSTEQDPTLVLEIPALQMHQVGGTHYEEMEIQPWDVVRTWPREQMIGYHKGTALAYIMRAGHKASVLEDLQKARHTLQELCNNLEALG